MIRLFFSIILLVSSLCFSAGHAVAASTSMAPPALLLKQSYLVDPKGALTIDDVQTMPFKPLEGPLARGYTPEVTWLKLEVAASTQPVLIVGVQPTFLDNVRLYSSDGPGSWTVQQQGDQFAYSQRPQKEVIFSFPVRPLAQQSSVHYLRVVTTSSHLLYVKVRSVEDSQSFNSALHSFMGLYLGLVFMMLLWALLRWIQTRDRLWAANVFLQLVSLSIAMSNMGFLAKFVLPNHPHLADLWVSYSGALQFFAGSFLVFGLVRTLQPQRWVLVGFGLPVFVVSPIVLILLVLGQVRAGMSFNTFALLVVPMINIAGLFFVPPSDRTLRYTLRATYIVLTLYLLYFSLPVFGLATMTDMHLSPALMANFFTSAMLLLVLMRRDHLVSQADLQMAIEAQKTNQQLTWEQQRREENTSFISVLLQELKTPLSSIRLTAMSLGSKKDVDPRLVERRLQNIQISIDDMDKVLEQTRETDRLERGALHLELETLDIIPILKTVIAEKNFQHRVIVQLPPSCRLTVDVKLFTMMIKNLLDNALNYSPTGSLVQVWLREIGYEARKVATEKAVDGITGDVPQKFIALSIHNEVVNGVLPDAQKIFQKYYRGASSHHIIGIGLGLYWTKGVAAQMGGSLSYSHAKTQVIFELQLPIANAQMLTTSQIMASA